MFDNDFFKKLWVQVLGGLVVAGIVGVIGWFNWGAISSFFLSPVTVPAYAPLFAYLLGIFSILLYY